jgi:copper/silver efflux system protein
MSLGGIALAIGVLVDAAVVMVENAHRRTAEESRPNHADRVAVLTDAARQVGRPVFFSMCVILISFLPIFFLESQEGRLFEPLALTKTVGVTAATLLAITLVPAVMVMLLNVAPPRSAGPNAVTRVCNRFYEPILRLALRRRWTFLLANVAVLPLTALLVPRLGHEFLPPLYEGSFLYMPTASPGLSVTEASRLVQIQDRIIREFPEVERVFGTAGRATTATDNSPLNMINTTITLKPRDQWRPGMTVDALRSAFDSALPIPGIPNVWTQPIRSRIDMLSTGIKTAIGIKILGTRLDEIEAIGLRIESVLRTMPGTSSVYAERTGAGYFADVAIDRASIARYGLTLEDVQTVVQTAIGGTNVGYVLEGRERYPITVRYQYDFRADLAAIERVFVPTPGGRQVSLGQLATLSITTGPSMIRNENGLLAGYVYVDISTTDLSGYVDRAQRAIEDSIALPTGYRLDWSGQYEAHLRSSARLRLIIPIALLMVGALLYMTFGSVSEAAIVMLSVLYAMTGGVLLQWWLGYNFSVAVWVGYLALYGVAVQTGVIMVIYLREALDQRIANGNPLSEDDLLEATVAGAVQRLRPKLMTVCATTLGLVPILWSSGIGADVLKPVAAPIVGGMLTSAIHVLLITPVIFLIAERKRLS